MGKAEDTKAALRERPADDRPRHFLGTGSTLLNLACSGRAEGGWPEGGYAHLVGDPSSGKTFLALTCFAEACLSRHFRKHRFIFDNAENGALMDLEKFFGREVARRLEPPAGSRDDPTYSSTVEEFYYHADDALKKGPCVYVLDSMDALVPADDADQFDREKAAHASGKTVSGSYGTAKAKRNAAGLRMIATQRLKGSGSVLLILSQASDNIGFGSQFNPKTFSGGTRLKFYAQLQVWFSVRGHVKGTHKGKTVEQGIVSQIRVKKNRVTGRESAVEVPILWSFGVDDLGSCVDYLTEVGHWKKKGGTILAEELGEEGPREQLVAAVEAQGTEAVLRATVAQAWKAVEEACAVRRKRRYE